jgi:hypothetical protein
MSDILTTVQRVPALVCAPDGAKITSERDAVELVAVALEQGADLVVVPIERLDGGFFHLETRLAGHIAQKFVTYRRHLVIVGDISGYVAKSRALRDFVYETNRGAEVWFVKDLQELNEPLA